MKLKTLLLLLLLAASARGAPAGEKPPARVALVIGNDRYEPAIGPLRNPGRDAKAMAKALRTLGFTVLEKHNVSRDELLGALLQFRAKLRGAQVGLFYFAGHGLAVGGANYLLPVKSGYPPEGGGERLLAETKLFNAEQAVAEMSHAGAACNLVILDACRSTPAAHDPATRDVTAGGLVEMNPPAGSLVAFATDSGHTAADGAGTNGLYTEELIRHLLTPGLSIEQVFKRTRAGVMARSGGTQVPAEYSRLVGDDIFLAAEPAPAAVTLAEVTRLAVGGEAARSVEKLREYTRVHDLITGQQAAPLAILLNQVKENLRDPKTAPAHAARALEVCTLISVAIVDCLTFDPARNALAAKTENRRGDALLLLNRPAEALTAYNLAAPLAPDDGYILYNRGRAFLALGRREEAAADFTLAAGAKFKGSAVRPLAQQALAGMKASDDSRSRRDQRD